ncbi:MAG: hypothetical protein ABIL66_04950 [candidate division WOR-3 bacterium]
MHRIILAIITFIFCLLWAEVKVEKVLETTSIKEYNQWVKRNKEKYPGLKLIYIQCETVREPDLRRLRDYVPEKTFDPPPTNPFTYEYKVSYYDDNGKIVKDEIISGYAAVYLSPNFDEILISKRDHPSYPEKRITIVKDKKGNVKFTLNDVFSLRAIDTDLYIEYADYEMGATSLRLFDGNGNVIGKLEGASAPFNDRLPAVSSFDKKFFVCGYLQEPDWKPGLVFLFSKTGEILWRKEFAWQEKAPWGLYPSISGNGNMIAVGHVNKVYVYKRNGELWREYSYEPPYPALTALSEDGRFLAVATRDAGTKVFLYDNVNGELVWSTKIEHFTPSLSNIITLAISSNGKYVGLQLRPNVVYLFGPKGEILKEWNLGGIVSHPAAPSGKRVTVHLGMSTYLQFIKDMFVIKYFNPEVSYIIERVEEK